MSQIEVIPTIQQTEELMKKYRMKEIKYTMNKDHTNTFCTMTFNNEQDATKALRYVDGVKLFGESAHYNYMDKNNKSHSSASKGH